MKTRQLRPAWRQQVSWRRVWRGGQALPLWRMRQVRWSALLLIGALAGLALTATLAAASGGPGGQSTVEKQMKLQQAAAQQAASARGPRAAKHHIATPTSCPMPAVHSGIGVGDDGGFHEAIRNTAVVGPSSGQPFIYQIYAGARRDDTRQGLMIVVRMVQDSCAAGAAPTQVLYFTTPFLQGALTLTSLQGNTVTFTTAAGSRGRFNYLTGQFA